MFRLTVFSQLAFGFLSLSNMSRIMSCSDGKELKACDLVDYQAWFFFA
jgi:hypothetical protein